MKSQCISFDEIPHSTDLFCTFLKKFDRLSNYFAFPPTIDGVKASASQVNLDPANRRLLVEILSEQNARFAPQGQLDRAAHRNLDRLASGAAAIVTGQQVGLFSGPALTIYKALSAIRCAEEITCRGTDAVPVFWIATEDHDLAEVNESFWNTRNGLARYELATDPATAGKSVGRIPLGETIESLAQTAAKSLEGPAAAEIAAAIRESYTPSETYGSSFAKLLARVLAGRGVLFIDPQDPRFDRLAAPVYRAAIESADELRELLLARSHDLEEAGYHAQVKVTPESTLLFYTVEGRREALRSRKDGSFSVGRTTFSKDDVISALQDNPEAFTPSALLRPIVQDTILPTAALIGGPAEIAYLAQANVVYGKLLGRMPAVLPRASFTIVEPPIKRFLEQYSLDVLDVFHGRQHMRQKMEQSSLPDDLTRKFTEDEDALRKLVATYRDPLSRLDSTLLGAVDSTEERIVGQFLKLKEKVGRAENFRTGVLDRHERILLDALYFNHELQERHLSLLPHLAIHGSELLDQMLRMMPAPGAGDTSGCSGQHHVLFLD